MKKTEVQVRSANEMAWTYGVPAINVKWYPYLSDIERKFRETGHVYSGDAEFWAWFDRLDHDKASEYPHGEFEIASEMARETGWEDAKELAEEIFTGNIKVWSQGRSGGWLVVEGLGEVEGWDANAVSRWARFQRGVQSILDDLDYQFIWHLAVNVFERERDAHFEFYRRLSA